MFYLWLVVVALGTVTTLTLMDARRNARGGRTWRIGR